MSASHHINPGDGILQIDPSFLTHTGANWGCFSRYLVTRTLSETKILVYTGRWGGRRAAAAFVMRRQWRADQTEPQDGFGKQRLMRAARAK